MDGARVPGATKCLRSDCGAPSIYEQVYLKADEAVCAARSDLYTYIDC
jgi:hypothetical protein